MATADPHQPRISNGPLEVREVRELQARGIKKVRLVSEGQYKASLKLAVGKATVELLGDLDLPEEVLLLIRERAFDEIARGSDDRGTGRSVSAGGEDHPGLEEPPPPESRPETIDDVSRVLSADWREEIDDVRDSQRLQVERLEARIENLMQALNATDQLLLGLAEITTTASTGTQEEIDTPGLLMGKKSELLEQLFQANLVLRELESGNAMGLEIDHGEES